MDSVALVLALGIVGVYLLEIAFRLDSEHYFFKVIAIFFSLFVIILIPKAMLDTQQTCGIVTNSSTVTDNTTTYTYVEFCSDIETRTVSTFFGIVVWFMRLFYIYIILYLNYAIWIKKVLKNKGIMR